jgi:hypothetical protein
MKGQNKRSITTYVPSPTSKPITTKKADAKETPNKTTQEEIGELQQKHHIALDNNDINQGDNHDPWNRHQEYGSDTWCAAKNKCSNRNERATSRKKCANCLGCTHLECFGINRNAFCLTCDDEDNTRKKPKDKAYINTPVTPTTRNEIKGKAHTNKLSFGTSKLCAAQEQCTKQFNAASDLYICYQCSLNVHDECIKKR